MLAEFLYYDLLTLFGKSLKTNLKFLYPYKNFNDYLKRVQQGENCEEVWDKIMIYPYWNEIAQWYPRNMVNRIKPKPIKNINVVEKQIESFSKLDLSNYEKEFKQIVDKLPRGHAYPIKVAFYPSDSYSLVEGIYGYCLYGNILISVNPLIDNYSDWIPFTFAHEYHHCVLFFYWYNIKKCKETRNNLLENIINEGQADEFAKSLFPGYEPSWHKGVSVENEKNTWKIFEKVLYEVMTIEELQKYMFGSKEDGIPPNAGYYFGSKIVKSYMKKYPEVNFRELIKIPHQIIFNEGCGL